MPDGIDRRSLGCSRQRHFGRGESLPTIGKRFAELGIPSRKENRRAYRELPFTTPHLHECMSGATLQDETTTQRTRIGESLPGVLTSRRIIPGIKVDEGPSSCPISPAKNSPPGSTDCAIGSSPIGSGRPLPQVARAVIAIGNGFPTASVIATNAHQLALNRFLFVLIGIKSSYTALPPWPGLLNGVLAHIFLVGIPIAFFAARRRRHEWDRMGG